MPSPYPPSTSPPPPGWSLPWSDYIAEGVCEVKAYAHNEMEHTPGIQKAGRWEGLQTAIKWCQAHENWKTSPEAVQENLGIQYGADFATVNGIMNGTFAVYGKGSGEGLTSPMWDTVKKLWNTKDAAAFRKVTGGYSLTMLIPIWNKLNTQAQEWFCQFKPWVPISLWKADQQRIGKTKLLLTGSIPSLSGSALASAIWMKDKKVKGAMAQPSCYFADPADVVEATKAGTLDYLEERATSDARYSMISNAISLTNMGFATPAQVEIAQAHLPPGDQEDPTEPPPDDEDKKGNMLPLILAGLGFFAAGPPGALGGFALGAMVAKGEK